MVAAPAGSIATSGLVLPNGVMLDLVCGSPSQRECAPSELIRLAEIVMPHNEITALQNQQGIDSYESEGREFEFLRAAIISATSGKRIGLAGLESVW